ncbi:TRNA-SPLICING ENDONUCLEASE SUBUNIT SEN54 [Salix purpurea]|uniref:tRNA-SPLICING ENDONUCLEASE SUBUNIT SEN54 n=1 Tax=Salix purpurea TaxID=77065 RepID=A0A9Q0USZ2_SALPP|nr:TRNA-SPLICING ENDONUCLEASE SUBUNIT SEN54 [Salix purpurea]
MDAEDEWESSSGEVADTDQFNDEDFYPTSACLSKLQFRFLAEIGALLVMDDNDECLALKDIYKKIAGERNGCSWELFEVYKHLKSLGYIVGRHGVPWSLKGVENNREPCSSQGTIQNNRVVGAEENSITCVVQMLSNLQVDELRLNFRRLSSK